MRLVAAAVAVVVAVAIAGGCAVIDRVLVDADDADGVDVDAAIVDDVERDTVALRGLPFRRDVPLEVLSVAELEQWLNRYYDGYKEALKRQDYFYHKMGILPPTRDSASTWKGFLGGFAGGVYDDDRVGPDGNKGTMILVRDYAWWSKVQFDMLAVMNGVDFAYEIFLAHELTHALQDQHFDLNRLLRDVANDDVRMVQKIVLESEANVVGMAHFAGMRLDTFAQRKAFFGFLRYNNFFNAPMLSALAGKTPSFFSRQTFAQYELGLEWVEQRLDDGEWKLRVEGSGHGAQAELALAYGRVPGTEGALPASTEQLLFADKRHDPPRRLPRLPLDEAGHFAPLGGAVYVDGDVFGALALKHWIEEPFVSAADVANGWGGDRYDVFVEDVDEDEDDDKNDEDQGGESTILVWRFLGDTPADAMEIADAVRARFVRSVGEERTTPLPGAPPGRTRLLVRAAPQEAKRVRTRRDEVLAVDVRGDRVVVVHGVAATADVEAIVDAVFAVTVDVDDKGVAAAQREASQAIVVGIEEAVASVPAAPTTPSLRERIVLPHRMMAARVGGVANVIVDDGPDANNAAGAAVDAYGGLDVEGRWGVREHLEFALPAALTLHTGHNDDDDAPPFVLALGVAPGALSFFDPIGGTWSARVALTAAYTSSTVAAVAQLEAAPRVRLAAWEERTATWAVRGALLMRVVDAVVVAPGVAVDVAAGGAAGVDVDAGAGVDVVDVVDVVTVGSAWQRGFVTAPLVEIEVLPGLLLYGAASASFEVARADGARGLRDARVGGGALLYF
jgi:hypothetical protein